MFPNAVSEAISGFAFGAEICANLSAQGLTSRDLCLPVGQADRGGCHAYKSRTDQSDPTSWMVEGVEGKALG